MILIRIFVTVRWKLLYYIRVVVGTNWRTQLAQVTNEQATDQPEFCFNVSCLFHECWEYRVTHDLCGKLWGATDIAGRFIFCKQPVSSDASFGSYAPLFEAYRAGTCTRSVHFESVYDYVYNVEPTNDAFSLPTTLRLCRQSITLETAYNHPSRMDVFDLCGQHDHPTSCTSMFFFGGMWRVSWTPPQRN
jgi:hypothetical protein